MNLNLKKPLVIFDLESTGLNMANDRIIEYCFIKVMPNGEKKTLQKRLNPGFPIPAFITQLTGISDADVAEAPKFIEVAKNLAQFLEGCDLCGFNMLKFDLPMLVEEFLKANVDFKIEGRNLVDAQKIFHLMEPRNLAAAYKFYCQAELENAHTAEADTEATLEILMSQVAKYENVEIKDKDHKEPIVPVKNDMAWLHKLSVSNNVDLSGRFVFNEKGEELVNFGKHKDKLVTSILKNEPSYYDWFMKSDFPLESKRKFTEIKIREMSNK
ncbi:MAG: exonuclease domain-containing protein [Cytophagales bacterium]